MLKKFLLSILLLAVFSVNFMAAQGGMLLLGVGNSVGTVAPTWPKHTAAGSLDTLSVTTSALDTTGAVGVYIVDTYYFTGTAAVPSDSKSNSWTAIDSDFNDPFFTIIYRCDDPCTVGSGHTFTISSGMVGTYPSIAVQAYPAMYGIGSTASDHNHVSSANSIAIDAITPPMDGAVIVGVVGAWAAMATDHLGNASVDSGFTVLDTIGAASIVHGQLVSIYKIQSTAATVSPTVSWDGEAMTAGGVQGSFQ